MQMMSPINIAEIETQYDVLDELMGIVPDKRCICAMCCFPITSDRPLHNDAEICMNCFTQINNGDFSLGDNSSSNNVDITKCCVLCLNEIPDGHARHMDSNMCTKCVTMLKIGDYELVLNEETNEQIPDLTEEMSPKHNDPSMPLHDSVHRPSSPVRESEGYIDQAFQNAERTDYKDSLLASLYSQVEFLRKQVEEENVINRNLVKYIMSMSGIKLDSTLPQKLSLNISRTPSTSVSSSVDDNDNDATDDESESRQRFEEYVQPPPITQQQRQHLKKQEQRQHHQQQHHHQPQQQQRQQHQNALNPQQQREQTLKQHLHKPKNTTEQLNDYVTRKRAAYEEEKVKTASLQSPRSTNAQFAAWEKHSSKYGSRMMSRWGYAGGGLGKDGTGITSPIKAQPSLKASTDSTIWPRNTTLIIGDSMLNGIEEVRLRRYNAKVVACPGATIKDVYRIVTPLLAKKPSKVIVHVGTNDCPYKPSDVIVNELGLLRTFIENNLPGGTVVISCPIMRTDNKLANSTIRAIAVAMDSMPNTILNNKINAFCLGQKGLHLNKKGSGKLALNFISKMQCV